MHASLHNAPLPLPRFQMTVEWWRAGQQGLWRVHARPSDVGTRRFPSSKWRLRIDYSLMRTLRASGASVTLLLVLCPGRAPQCAFKLMLAPPVSVVAESDLRQCIGRCYWERLQHSSAGVLSL